MPASTSGSLMGLEGTPLYQIAWHMVCPGPAAENGATGTQLTAIFGWATSKQVTQYTRVVDQRICSSRVPRTRAGPCPMALGSAHALARLTTSRQPRRR